MTFARDYPFNQPVILASTSPRRRRILDLLRLPFEVVPSRAEEIPLKGENAADFAERAARDKATEVADRYPDHLVLGADTVVEIDGRILGKPHSAADAAAMLRTLAGREHAVHTGLALVGNQRAHTLVDTATVCFLKIDDTMIDWYVASGEPMDKAGAYAVQGLGGLLVKGLKGSPHTVVGLPIHRLPELFAAHDVDFLALSGNPGEPS